MDSKGYQKEYRQAQNTYSQPENPYNQPGSWQSEQVNKVLLKLKKEGYAPATEESDSDDEY